MISRVWQLAAGRSFLARGLCLLLATIVASATYGQSVSEYQVKAAFLYNFVKFVEWPENNFTSSSTALTLCVLGQDELSAELERSVAGKSVLQRQISAVRLDSPAQARGCHVLFIGESQSHAIKRILREVQGGAGVDGGRYSRISRARRHDQVCDHGRTGRVRDQQCGGTIRTREDQFQVASSGKAEIAGRP